MSSILDVESDTSDRPDRMCGAFADHYRCPPEFAAFGIAGELSSDEAYFTFHDAVCYGRRRPIAWPESPEDLSSAVELDRGRVKLPFDLSEVVTNLQRERYCRPSPQGGLSRELYYLLRPLLTVPVRKHLQRIRLRGWDRIAFPSWPVDFSVEALLESAMALQLKAAAVQEIPFIWFWPGGAPGCGVMTHDVEDRAGRDFCDRLMDLDDARGIKSAFHVVPEGRYEVPDSFLEGFRARGFELNVHDLNHDGRLFQSRELFLRRAVRINEYGRKFRSRGFRSGTMYRQQDWFDALDFSYDMSVPNVAHLEPQRGGCCTVMPYFNGDILELPLTTAQDYSLFHILDDYSISLWKRQIELILARNGLVSFVTHPDYLSDPRAQAVYLELLEHLCRLRDEDKIWWAVPGDVDRWWRNRSRMTLVRSNRGWRIEGPDAHRARVAFARLENGRVVYSVDTQSV